MKTSLRRLRGALHRHEAKERRDVRPLAQKNELARASQDMRDMRDCYDSLLSAAAATANSAYEFSESLRELGFCLLEKTAINDDEESGRVLLMLGKAQFELQKIVDNYRSHIFQTITIPSESLLNELRTVEEMKRQCDDKRNVYDYMLMKQREKGKSKAVKEESFSMQQLQEAHDEYDEEATLFFFRLKSLKQGQNRSLLTQAARHHAAQLSFFRKALKSLEEVDPHVKQVTEQQHIDYHFSGLEDDDGDDGIDNNDEDGSEARDDGELSFDYRGTEQDQDAVSTGCNSVEFDRSDITFPQVARADTAKENLERSYKKSFSFRGEIRAGSLSAPVFMENNTSYPSEKLLQTRPSLTRKFNTYVLPTPLETKSPTSTESGKVVSHTPRTSVSSREHTHNLRHSSPLDLKRDISGDAKVKSVLKESNKHMASSQFPLPLSDGLLYSRLSQLNTSDSNKIRRQSFSGPLTSKQWFNKPASAVPHLYSGPILQNPITKLPSSSPKVSLTPKVSSSPRISPSASPTFVSSPKISELHELPRPPSASTYKSFRVLGYSAPLVSKGQLLSNSNKPLISNSASPLPKPPPITRSFSIPSSSHKVAALGASKPPEDAQKLDSVEGVASSPVTPLSTIQESSTVT